MFLPPFHLPAAASKSDPIPSWLKFPETQDPKAPEACRSSPCPRCPPRLPTSHSSALWPPHTLASPCLPTCCPSVIQLADLPLQSREASSLWALLPRAHAQRAHLLGPLAELSLLLCEMWLILVLPHKVAPWLERDDNLGRETAGHMRCWPSPLVFHCLLPWTMSSVHDCFPAVLAHSRHSKMSAERLNEGWGPGPDCTFRV